MALEGGMGMNETQSLSCRRAQGLGGGRGPPAGSWLALAISVLFAGLAWLLPQLGCCTDEGAHSPTHVHYQEIDSLYNVLSEEGKKLTRSAKKSTCFQARPYLITEEIARHSKEGTCDLRLSMSGIQPQL